VKVNLLILFSLLVLSACGGGKSTVKLEVTRSFSSSNSTFDGGLYIVGKNATNGDEFAVSLTTESSTSLNLNYGNWDIKVIGWDNGGKLFEGDVLCGSTTINFKKEVDSAPITVSPDCDALNPLLLKVYTCGALYDPSSPNNLRSGSSLTAAFCESYPPAWQYKAKGYKISLLDKLPGENFSEGITSACIQTTSYVPQEYLSTKLPLKVTLFDDVDCLAAKKMGSFEFPKGLGEYSRSSHPFDAVVSTGYTGNTFLALPTSISKRGVSPFLTELPSFNCGTNAPCFQLPDLPTLINSGTAYDYVLSHGFNSILLKPGTTTKCNQVQFTSSTSGTGTPQSNDIQNTDCIQDPITGDLILNLEVDHNVTAASNIFFSINNGTSKKYVMINSPAVQTFRTLKEVLGTPFTANQIKNSFIENNHDGNGGNEESKGMLSDPVDILSPAKVGGVFWDQTCSATPMSAAIKRSVTFFDEGMEKNYQLILTNPPTGLVPSFIGYQTNSWGETISQSFNRRMIIRSFQGLLGYKTEMLMDIVCDGITSLVSTGAIKVGRLEVFHSNTDNTENKSHTHRKIIFWNTTDSLKSRFENYEMGEEFDISTTTPILRRKHSSFTRAEKHGTESIPDQTKIAQLNYNFESGTNNGSNWKREGLDQNEINISGSNITSYPKQRLETQNQPPGSIFNDEAYTAQLNRIRYNNEDPNNKIKVLSSGKMVSVKNVNGTLHIQYSNGSTTTNISWQPTQTASTIQTTFDLDISPDGGEVIVVSGTNSSTLIKAKIFDGTNWVDQETSLSGTSGINKIKARILNDGIIAVAAISSSNQLYYGINSSATSNELPSVTSEFGSLSSSAGGAAGTPAGYTFNQSTTVIPMISDVDIAKNGSNFWIFRKFQMTTAIPGEPTNTIKGINYCIINTSNTSCTPSTDTTNGNMYPVEESTFLGSGNYQIPVQLYDFSIYNSEDLGTIKISFNSIITNQDGTTQEIIRNRTLINPSGTSSSDTTSSPNNNWSMSNINLNTISFTPPATQPTVLFNSPFQKPSVPSFKMNFMGLKPSVFESTVFTEKNTFQAIGNGL
jgi:hypothetical protein